jgi:FixJ family two-component response regulator
VNETASTDAIRGGLEGPTRVVWIVDDEPHAAELAADLCTAAGLRSLIFGSHQPYLDALRDREAPFAVVLDWRLENQLSAGVFMATRHRFPELPIIYWTASTSTDLPDMIRDDPATAVVDKARGNGAFERALAWVVNGARPR